MGGAKFDFYQSQDLHVHSTVYIFESVDEMYSLSPNIIGLVEIS